MPFSGFPFLFGFLPLFLGGFALASRYGDGVAKGWLMGCSLLFYGLGAGAYLPLLIVSVVGNYGCLWGMHRARWPGRWAGVGIAVNVAVLAGFKLFAAATPLGLSFFTFSQIGCLLYYAGGDRAPPRALDYALFAACFPALLAGPVLRAGDILPRIECAGGLRPTRQNIQIGSGFFILGLVKKTLLADSLVPVVTAGFADPAGLTLFPAWHAATAYSLQLYFDFSGYTDMAIGLAWMVGLRFPDNFDAPYRKASVIEYWQSWHMSLTRFLMTHVHAPLTLAVLRWRRARGRPVSALAQRTIGGFATMIAAPIVVTMVAISLWHGCTLPFLAFGLLHAVFLCINHAWRVWRGPALPRLAATVVTYLCVLVGTVIFRSVSLPAAGSALAAMVGLHGAAFAAVEARDVAGIAWLAVLYAIVWFAPTTRQIMLDGAWQPSPRWAVVMGCAATAGILAAGGTTEFVYFRF